VTLPADSYQLAQVELAGLPDDEQREAARWQIRDLLNFPADEAVVDIYAVPPYGSERRPLTYAVAAQEKFLRSQVTLIKSAGLSLCAIDIPEFALRNLTDLYAADSRGVAILRLLENDGLLVVARDGMLYLTRSFPIGMNDLLPHADGDTEALAEQVDAIVLEIQRSFDYCESTFGLPTVSRLLVAQTQREIPAVISYLDNFLAPKVEPLDFSAVLNLPADSEQLELNRHLLAIGAALRQEGV
jgi:MSHA biogenesis protein MshI